VFEIKFTISQPDIPIGMGEGEGIVNERIGVNNLLVILF